LSLISFSPFPILLLDKMCSIAILNNQFAGGVAMSQSAASYFLHPSSYVDAGAQIGKKTKIWHFCHISAGAKIGEACILGQNTFVADGVEIGKNCKIQNNVSVYSGTIIEDDVFLGPSCVLTNVTNPRSQVVRHSLYEKTLIRHGASIGANATIVCGIEIGRYAFIAAGAVVTTNVPDYALMVGVPARQKGWMSRHGHRLRQSTENGIMVCPESGYRYRELQPGVLRCLDLSEDSPLPAELAVGSGTYDQFKNRP
jgi:UDP-2-acetamido-3-amino-2,3-dideoxy-glucuronate N-acetyltransferase